ncbi:hypothetical protein B0H19DRAFT_1069886 [Mycena capillaripes]|nr:hypothetical protein B0H19DRAFT_1069886 [Mycena capillaripes]
MLFYNFKLNHAQHFLLQYLIAIPQQTAVPQFYLRPTLTDFTQREPDKTVAKTRKSSHNYKLVKASRTRLPNSVSRYASTSSAKMKGHLELTKSMEVVAKYFAPPNIWLEIADYPWRIIDNDGSPYVGSTTWMALRPDRTVPDVNILQCKFDYTSVTIIQSGSIYFGTFGAKNHEVCCCLDLPLAIVGLVNCWEEAGLKENEGHISKLKMGLIPFCPRYASTGLGSSANFRLNRQTRVTEAAPLPRRVRYDGNLGASSGEAGIQ